jgi:glycine/D-amino acid oxidase-like deaminating enzyme
MQAEAVEIFRELEKKTGTEMLHTGGLLYMKPVGHPDIQEFMKYGEKLTAAEINRRWPAFTIPDYIEGVFTVEAGVANVKNALKGCR